MSTRNTKREGEQIDQMFAQIYKPVEAMLDECPFDTMSGTLSIPGWIGGVVNDANQRWNYHATIFNKKFKGAKANFGAIKVKWDKDSKIREMRMFMTTVSHVIRTKYNLTEKDIDPEFIAKMKEEGKTPEEIVDLRIMELSETVTPFSRFDHKHKHEWEVIQDRFFNWHVICRTCLRFYCRSHETKEQALAVAVKLPRTNLRLLINHFKKY
jgi:hypothetical protein